MFGVRRRSALVILALLSCMPSRTPAPRGPEETEIEPTPAGETGTQVIVAQPRDVGTVAYDLVIADLVGECDAALESTGDAEPPRVSDRRVDLDGDGQDEAIVNVSCADLSMWRVLTLRDEEAVVLREEYATGTRYEVTRAPDGRTLLVVEHDCCCMYELGVHQLRGEALEPVYTFDSGCAPGCDDGMGYQATVNVDERSTLAIDVPLGECGAEGSHRVDLATLVAGR